MVNMITIRKRNAAISAQAILRFIQILNILLAYFALCFSATGAVIMPNGPVIRFVFYEMFFAGLISVVFFVFLLIIYSPLPNTLNSFRFMTCGVLSGRLSIALEIVLPPSVSTVTIFLSILKIILTALAAEFITTLFAISVKTIHIILGAMKVFWRGGVFIATDFADFSWGVHSASLSLSRLVKSSQVIRVTTFRPVELGY